ncbi:hypothetical protein EG834_00930 [bacterium]|nr:hypothetical protein [bacterium]
MGLSGMTSWESDGELDSENLSVKFALQLVPEYAEMVSNYARVCFVDAHTGEIPEEVSVRPLLAAFQSSPFTHHLTPEACLAIAGTFSPHLPEAILVSVRGYSFEFSQQLSAQTAALVDLAVDAVCSWLEAD